MVFNCVANFYQQKNITPFIYTILHSPVISCATTFMLSKVRHSEVAEL